MGPGGLAGDQFRQLFAVRLLRLLLCFRRARRHTGHELQLGIHRKRGVFRIDDRRLRSGRILPSDGQNGTMRREK